MSDTKTIEEEAVDAVKRTIRTVKLLSAYITENDKGPCWDGYITIHENEKKNNKGIKRVEVQVKGTEDPIPNEQYTKRKVKVEDLEAYRIHGGVIYFVVHERKEKGERFPINKIFYLDLLPFRIYKILSRKKQKDQKYITVEFKPFPEDPDEIMTVFHQFIK